MKKYIRPLISILTAITVVLLLAYGVTQSDFSNLQKYDSKGGSNKMHSTVDFKDNIAIGMNYKTEVTIENSGMANLGDFTINIAGDRKLITNISLMYEKNKSTGWMSDSDIEDEILCKGDILRDSVIKNISGQHVNMQNNKIKRLLKKNINRNLSDGKVVEVYFNTFIVQ